MTTPIAFYLDALDFDATAIAALFAGVSPTPATQQNVHLEMNYSSADLQKMFLFHTDAIDLVDASASDILYYLDSTFATDLSGVILNSICVMGGNKDTGAGTLDGVTPYVINTSSVNRAATNQLVYTAKCLFNICEGVDLFENEIAFRTGFNTNACGSLKDILDAINVADGGETGGYDAHWIPTGTLVSGDKVHPSEVLLQAILSNDPSRLANSVSLSNSVAGKNQYYMPFIVDDSIEFVMHVSAASGQRLTNGLVVDTEIPVRSYKFKINVIA